MDLLLCLTDFYTGLAGRPLQLRASRVCSAGGCAGSQACFLACQVGRTRRERRPRFPSKSSCERRCCCRGCFGASPCVLSVPNEQRTRHLIEPPLLARPSRLPPVSETEERAVKPTLRRPRPGRGFSAEVQAVDGRGMAAIACRPVQELLGANRRPQCTLHLTSAPALPVPRSPPRPAPPRLARTSPVPRPYLSRISLGRTAPPPVWAPLPTRVMTYRKRRAHPRSAQRAPCCCGDAWRP